MNLGILCGTLLTSALTLVLAATPSAAAELFRWKDANGNPVVSDRPPPPGTPYTTLNGRRYGMTSNKRSQPSVSSSPSTGGSSSKTKTTRADEAAPKLAQRPKPDPAKCAQAQNNITTLTTFARVRITDASGELRFLTDEERQAQLDAAQSMAELHCE